MKLNLSSTEKKYLQEVLSFTEAEKYIKKFKNKIFVIKYGGSALSDKYLANNFAKDLVLIKKLGINLVVVHGGGVQISETLKKEKLDTKFINGLRVTYEKTIKMEIFKKKKYPGEGPTTVFKCTCHGFGSPGPPRRGGGETAPEGGGG